MGTFASEYKKLNAAQKSAVDAIDGPVLVIAGPGTGKTQLLSTRVANILDKTDTPASSILCLTFTDSAARTMRNRLISIIGEDAYHVAIHTFHSFGLEIMGQYPQYFSKTIGFGAIDDVTRHEIIESILSKLPKSNPLAVKDYGGQLIWRSAVIKAIPELKKAALNPKQLLELLEKNEEFLNFASPLLNDALSGRWVAKNIAGITKKTAALLPKLKEFKSDKLPNDISSINNILHAELSEVLNGPPEELKQWRDNRMVGKDGERRLKDLDQLEKLRSLANVYKQYDKELKARRLHDYDDMILSVIEQLNLDPDLKADLQERYLYVLVDEFQDTSEAQLRMLMSLLDSPVYEGRPNVMVVGDDDQAIYRFQGAESSNMINYRDSFTNTEAFSITKNYRSAQGILDVAEHVAGFGHDRLIDKYPEISKTLSPDTDEPALVKNVMLADSNSERHWVAKEVEKLLKSGVPAEEIAIIGRYHDDLVEILPHLTAPVRYERRDDVLAEKHIHELVVLARAVVALQRGDHNQLAEYLSEIINYEFWHISVEDIWQFALSAKSSRGTHWFELMLKSDNDQIKLIASFLGELAKREPLYTAETMFDWLIGNNEFEIEPKPSSMVSPFKSHYFSSGTFASARSHYVDMLSSLSALRKVYRQWRQPGKNRLRDFIEFINTVERAGIRISDTAPHREDEHSVQLMTAHGAKGQEFEVVFIINATSEVWDKAKRGGTSLTWPANLPISIKGDEEDDRTRLFYVATTRAKRQLYISAPELLDSGKESTKLRFLNKRSESDLSQLEPETVELRDAEVLAERLSSEWSNQHRHNLGKGQHVLKEHLEKYQLSPTDLNAFTDVTKGGPKSFLVNNLLRFPSAKSPSQCFGTAIHGAVARVYIDNKLEQKKLLKDFERALSNEDLSQEDYSRELEHGQEVLTELVATKSIEAEPNTKVEYPFSREGVVVGKARLTGRIDKMTLIEGKWNNSGQILVSDWKTGKPRSSWANSDLGATKARAQLYFYKLLVENSRSFKNNAKVSQAELIYLEGPNRKLPMTLALKLDETELKRTRQLIEVVWQKIMALDFVDTSAYENSYKGVAKFETDLLSGSI